VANVSRDPQLLVVHKTKDAHVASAPSASCRSATKSWVPSKCKEWHPHLARF